MGNLREAQQMAAGGSVVSAGSSSGPPPPPQQPPSSEDSPPTFLETVSRTVSRMASLSGARRPTVDRSADASSSDSSARPRGSLSVAMATESRDRVTENERRTERGTWPNKSASFFACVSCILGMYNISRFSMLVYLYKGSFILEFIILSAVVGVPFLFFQMTLGQYLAAGITDMWFISPAFKGIGLALAYAYLIIGVYTAVPIAWLFVYFKDSFITARETYKWGQCNSKFALERCMMARNTSSSDYIGWTVPSYFHGRVLDRKSDTNALGDLRFEISFNLAIIWFLVFVCLCRGLRSYGKVVYVMGIMPLILLLLVAIRFLEGWGEGVITIFTSPWKPILTDSWSWLLAAREVFLTWGLFGGVALQMCSHNKPSVSITRNLIGVAVTVVITLILGSFFFVSVVHIAEKKRLVFVPTSYENPTHSQVVYQYNQVVPAAHNITPVNLLVGDNLASPFLGPQASGYQVMRFATEYFPAALASEGVQTISSFWSICFYGMMVLFGLGQLMAIWSCVVECVISFNIHLLKGWQTVLTFVLCAAALLTGLPMTTNIGIFIVYFLDFCMGSIWWITALYLIMLIAVLLIRGRPYGTDQLVTSITQNLHIRVWLLPVITFQWNIILPISYLVLSIAFLRTGQAGNTYSWAEQADHYMYWPIWVKRLSSAIQIGPLILVIVMCGYQAYRHLTPKSDQPLHERVQTWCCPAFPVTPRGSTASTASQQTQQGVINSAFEEDPPPKYTPPPSYSTATAKMIAKQLLRQTSSGIELGVVDLDKVSTTLVGLQNNISYDPQPTSVQPTDIVVAPPVQSSQQAATSTAS